MSSSQDEDEDAWTEEAQLKLDSLNDLLTRSNQFHQNFHIFNMMSTLHRPDDESIATCRYAIFDQENCLNTTVLKSLQCKDIDKLFSEFVRMRASSKKLESFLWIHLDHLDCIGKVFDCFSIHHSFYSYFFDLRANAVFLEESEKGSFLLTFCVLYFERQVHAKLKKVFVYMHPSFCLTCKLVFSLYLVVSSALNLILVCR